MFQACRDLGSTITAQAEAHGWTFPNVTVQNWELHASEARRRGALEAISFTMLLPTDESIQEFNAYAVQQSGWWQRESHREYRQLNPELANWTFGSSRDRFVYDLVDRSKPWLRAPRTTAPALPIWLQSPPSLGYTAMFFDMYWRWAPALASVVRTRGMYAVVHFAREQKRTKSP